MKTENKIAVLNRQILVANQEYDNANGFGPTLFVVVGALSILAIVGIPILVIGLFWAQRNRETRNAALDEIDELNAEIDELMEEA